MKPPHDIFSHAPATTRRDVSSPKNEIRTDDWGRRVFRAPPLLMSNPVGSELPFWFNNGVKTTHR